MVTDMETWVADNEGRIIRYLVYKRLFTPYEQEKKYMDESEFDDIHFRFGAIEEAIELGGGEWLLGIRMYDDIDFKPYNIIEYHKLSDIKLSFYERDMEGDTEEECG